MFKKLMIKTLALCILLSISFVGLDANAATDPNFVTNKQLQSSLDEIKKDMATKEELQGMVQQQGQPLTKEEITQQLIDTQKSRIGILEGNINALLMLLALIVAVLTLFGGIFVWISRRAFSTKVEEVEKRLEEMKQLKNEAITKIETVKELNSNLNVANREAVELQLELNKSKKLFKEGTERIDQLGKYVSFLELKTSRSELIRTFENHVRESIPLISELKQWLEGTLPNYGHALVKVTEIFGANVTRVSSDETILEKLDYNIKSLKKCEDLFLEQSSTPLKWEDYEERDIEDYIDTLNYRYEDWDGYYEGIKKVHSIIKTQITLNPDKFKPKEINWC